MEIPETIPPAKQEILRNAVDALMAVEGVLAIVLGGSYARGTQRANSDLDVGIYYTNSSPFSIERIRDIAIELSADKSPVVTDFYGWGPWVNGGAWIETPSGKLDLLYKNVEQIESTIQDATQGITHHDYNQQPTFGFYSVIYLAETHVCIPLWDPQGIIARFKEQVRSYPPKLKEAIVANTLWGAEFTLHFAIQYAQEGDVYNTTGCLTRVAGYLTQALFALNATYFINDKRALNAIKQFELYPPKYVERITQILACPGATSETRTQTVNSLQELWQEVVQLAGSLYEQKFPQVGVSST
jgi:hypothetical protein